MSQKLFSMRFNSGSLAFVLFYASDSAVSSLAGCLSFGYLSAAARPTNLTFNALMPNKSVKPHINSARDLLLSAVHKALFAVQSLINQFDCSL